MALATTLAGSLAAGYTVQGQGAPQGTTRGAQAGSLDARGFIEQMAIAGMAEVQLGKMAAERASNDDVKAFGQMMVKDHTQADQELMQIASRMSVRRRRHASFSSISSARAGFSRRSSRRIVQQPCDFRHQCPGQARFREHHVTPGQERLRHVGRTGVIAVTACARAGRAFALLDVSDQFQSRPVRQAQVGDDNARRSRAEPRERVGDRLGRHHLEASGGQRSGVHLRTVGVILEQKDKRSSH